jgi:hypothetical protein
MGSPINSPQLRSIDASKAATIRPGAVSGTAQNSIEGGQEAFEQPPEKTPDEILAENLRERGATEREIEEFKKLKKYSGNYRLRHVYR